MRGCDREGRLEERLCERRSLDLEIIVLVGLRDFGIGVGLYL